MRRSFALCLVCATVGWPAWSAIAGGEGKLALGEVSVPTPLPGADRAALASAAQGEIQKVDASRVKRRVIVSVAIVDASDTPVALTVDACLRDEKSGNMLAILKGRAAVEAGRSPPSPDVRGAVLRAAVRSALSQIPAALAGS